MVLVCHAILQDHMIITFENNFCQSVQKRRREGIKEEIERQLQSTL